MKEINLGKERIKIHGKYLKSDEKRQSRFPPVSPQACVIARLNRTHLYVAITGYGLDSRIAVVG